MRQFLKFMLASMVGTLLIGLVLIVLFVGTIAALGSAFNFEKKAAAVKDGSVLRISLEDRIVDQGPRDGFDLDLGPFSGAGSTGLNHILANIEKAKRDDRIKGIFLDLTYVSARMATVKEIRDKLLEFRTESGKPIVAFGEVMTQGTYYLASVADKVYLTPQGDLDLRGLRSETTFYKGLFDKLGVEVQFIRGSNNRFKSFGENLIQDHMSEANKQQTLALLNGLWGEYLDAVGGARNLDRDRLNVIADSLLVRHAPDAVSVGLVDDVKYRDEVLALMKEQMALPLDKEIPFVDLEDYTRTFVAKKDAEAAPVKDKVAVVFAQGDIVSGESSDGSVGSTTVCEALRKAREDSTVKAIVLRVNSPGGSGLASDVIWREVALTKAEKPVVVSMGDLAASGGYYIACGADRIWAEPNTITGSIGVFAIIPNMQKLFNDKLGLTFDGVQTNKHAGMLTTTRPLTAEERLILQGYIDRFYGTFKERVAEGRRLSVAQVDSIGQGRVWTGGDAKRIGLVDEIGGLEAAIADAAERAGLAEGTYKLRELPEKKEFFEELMQGFNSRARTWVAEQTLGTDLELMEHYETVRKVRAMSGIQARMPFELDVY
ncbi:MAG TPA: signal peptide peptidase SppA [Flavobacteriales bacterium]